MAVCPPPSPPPEHESDPNVSRTSGWVRNRLPSGRIEVVGTNFVKTERESLTGVLESLLTRLNRVITGDPRGREVLISLLVHHLLSYVLPSEVSFRPGGIYTPVPT